MEPDASLPGCSWRPTFGSCSRDFTGVSELLTALDLRFRGLTVDVEVSSEPTSPEHAPPRTQNISLSKLERETAGRAKQVCKGPMEVAAEQNKQTKSTKPRNGVLFSKGLTPTTALTMAILSI